MPRRSGEARQRVATVGCGCKRLIAGIGKGRVTAGSVGKELSGKFTSEWMQEHKSGGSRFKATRRLADEHQIEEVGAKLRDMMPWIKAGALVDKAKN